MIAKYYYSLLPLFWLSKIIDLFIINCLRTNRVKMLINTSYIFDMVYLKHFGLMIFIFFFFFHENYFIFFCRSNVLSINTFLRSIFKCICSQFSVTFYCHRCLSVNFSECCELIFIEQYF